MNVQDNFFNYLTKENHVKILQCSSNEKSCESNNLIDTSSKTVWLSLRSLPQFIIFDLTNMIRKPEPFFRYWAIHCWHAYETNPKEIEIECSNDNKSYHSLGRYQLLFKSGIQLFELTKKERKINYIKVIIHKTYGSIRTSINQLYFYDCMSNNKRSKSATVNNNIKGFIINNDKDKKSNDHRLESRNTLKFLGKKMINNIEEGSKHSSVNDSQRIFKVISIEKVSPWTDRLKKDFKSMTSRSIKTLIPLNQTNKKISDSMKQLRPCSIRKKIGKIYHSDRKNITDLIDNSQENSKRPILFSTFNNKHPSTTANSRFDQSDELSHYHHDTFRKGKILQVDNSDILSQDLTSQSIFSTKGKPVVSLYNKSNICTPKNNATPHINVFNKYTTLRENNKENSETNRRIINIEEKVLSMEKKVDYLKLGLNNLNSDIEKKIIMNKQHYKSHSINHSNYKEKCNQELVKITNCNNNEWPIQFQETQTEENDYINTEKVLPTKSYDIHINNQINKKFDDLITTFESKIYNDYLQPSIHSFENKVHNKITKMKKSIDTIINSQLISLKETMNESIDSNEKINISKEKKNKHSFNQEVFKKYDEISNELNAKLFEKQKELEDRSSHLKSLLQEREYKMSINNK